MQRFAIEIDILKFQHKVKGTHAQSGMGKEAKGSFTKVEGEGKGIPALGAQSTFDKGLEGEIIISSLGQGGGC